jgi:hypothetical protein
VYFGEANKQKEKHGFGINVQKKSIFEGKYNNNEQIEGYEKNVDGVYVGGFVNGVREGYGVFSWNNGEIY